MPDSNEENPIIAGDWIKLPTGLPGSSLFDQSLAPWEWIPRIAQALDQWFKGNGILLPNEIPPGFGIQGPVYIHPSVHLPPFGSIEGPVWIGEGCQLRPGCFIRPNTIAGPGCVLGNSSEFKNCLLAAECQVPHFSYVGDSILGKGAHLGAGAILSNLRFDHQPVTLRLPGKHRLKTNLRKMGAILGNHAEVGCQAVLQPGTLLGPRSVVWPLTRFGGYLKPGGVTQ